MNLLSIIWINKRRSYSNHNLAQPSMQHFNRIPRAIALPYSLSGPTSDLIGDDHLYSDWALGLLTQLAAQ